MQGREIAYRVRRSARATQPIVRVSPLGVEVVLGKRTSLKRAPEMMSHFAAWVIQRLDRLERSGQLLATQPGADGMLPDEILLRGMAVRVLWGSVPLSLPSVTGTSTGRPAARRRLAAARVALCNGVLHVSVTKDDPNAAQFLEGFLRNEARRDLQECVAHRAAQMGVSPIRVGVRAQRTRWGSCSRSGNLSFCWRIVLLPPALLDYLVVHELAHLREMNHGPRFWAIVAEFCPDWPAHRRALHNNGWRLVAPFTQQIRVRL